MGIKVKICGITNPEDALLAEKLGADAVGFIFADSKRRINPDNAGRISVLLGPFISRVGVFVNPTLEDVLYIGKRCLFDTIQLHGNETPGLVSQLIKSYKVIKTLRWHEGVAEEMNTFHADAFLFETPDKKLGGTGKTWDWKKLPRNIKKPVIITGGLNPGNVGQAIRATSPYAVDVSSGVEKKPGIKDAALLKRFIENAKKSKTQ